MYEQRAPYRVGGIVHGVKTNRVLLPCNAVIKGITYSRIVRPLGADLHDRLVVYTSDRFISTAIVGDCRSLELYLDTVSLARSMKSLSQLGQRGINSVLRSKISRHTDSEFILLLRVEIDGER